MGTIPYTPRLIGFFYLRNWRRQTNDCCFKSSDALPPLLSTTRESRSVAMPCFQEFSCGEKSVMINWRSDTVLPLLAEPPNISPDSEGFRMALIELQANCQNMVSFAPAIGFTSRSLQKERVRFAKYKVLKRVFVLNHKEAKRMRLTPFFAYQNSRTQR